MPVRHFGRLARLTLLALVLWTTLFGQTAPVQLPLPAPASPSTVEARPLDQAANAGHSYWLPYFDSTFPEFHGQVWIMVGNPNPAQVMVTIRVQGTNYGTWPVPPGNTRAIQLPNVFGGPLQVVGTNGEVLVVSVRTLYYSNPNNPSNQSLKEQIIPAIEDFSNTYYFTLYDAGNSRDHISAWIDIANPTASYINYQIVIGGVVQTLLNCGSWDPDPCTFKRLAPYSSDYWSAAGVTSGPVVITSTRNDGGTIYSPLIASIRTIQRALTEFSFHEELGIPATQLGADMVFPWWDASNGLRPLLYVANPWPTSIHVDVKLGSPDSAPACGAPCSVAVPPNGVTTISPTPGAWGPVIVRGYDEADYQQRGNAARRMPVVTDIRTFINASYTAPPGRPYTALTSDAWFTWYDASVTLNGIDMLQIANPTPYQVGLSVWLQGTTQLAGFDVGPYSYNYKN